MLPDDTTILDWYYLFRNDFGGERAPKVLVLSYARGQLTDATGIHAERIAGSFGGWSNAREMLRLDLDDLGDRIDYLLASTFRLFSERERVRDRVLATATPDYRSTAQRLNDSERAGRASGTARSAEAFSGCAGCWSSAGTGGSGSWSSPCRFREATGSIHACPVCCATGEPIFSTCARRRA